MTQTTDQALARLNVIFKQAKLAMVRAGFTVSEGGSWVNEENGQVYVSSVESVPNTYGHPKGEISYNDGTGWYVGRFPNWYDCFSCKWEFED